MSFASGLRASSSRIALGPSPTPFPRLFVRPMIVIHQSPVSHHSIRFATSSSSAKSSNPQSPMPSSSNPGFSSRPSPKPSPKPHSNSSQSRSGTGAGSGTGASTSTSNASETRSEHSRFTMQSVDSQLQRMEENQNPNRDGEGGQGGRRRKTVQMVRTPQQIHEADIHVLEPLVEAKFDWRWLLYEQMWNPSKLKQEFKDRFEYLQGRIARQFASATALTALHNEKVTRAPAKWGPLNLKITARAQSLISEMLETYIMLHQAQASGDLTAVRQTSMLTARTKAETVVRSNRRMKWELKSMAKGSPRMMWARMSYLDKERRLVQVCLRIESEQKLTITQPNGQPPEIITRNVTDHVVYQSLIPQPPNRRWMIRETVQVTPPMFLLNEKGREERSALVEKYNKLNQGIQ